MRTLIIINSLFIFLLASCIEGPNKPIVTDNFNRNDLLTFTADDVIIPAMEHYKSALTALIEDKNSFILNPDLGSLEKLRTSWLSAYKDWQSVSMFDIGKAETIGLRNFSNIYPTDVTLITSHINDGGYNLELPSTFASQGFPALDYLLFGLAETNDNQLDILNQQEYLDYISELVERLNSLASLVLNDWKNGFREEFISNDGSSGTASFDKLVNDYLFYYEKYFRAGKIGIPAGVFSGNTLSHTVEAPYSEIYSKDLYEKAFSMVRKFFNGKSFDELSEGQCMASYLDYIRTQNEGEDLVKLINDHWDIVHEKVMDLDGNFKSQVEIDHVKMLEVYDAMQKVVILLKVDVLQALNVQIDYVDADGD